MIHVCTIPGCEAKFSRPYRLKLHLLKHSGEKPFKCEEPDCHKAYSNSSHLRRHKLKVHDGIKNDLKRCPEKNCLRLIASNNLQRHLQTVHNIEQQIYCAICNQGFRKKNQLKSHMYEHTGLKPYTCDYCSLGFVNISEYKKHKRNHKSYKCSCGEIFYRWTVYLKHKRESDKHDQFSCEICEKKFKYKRNYKIHLTTHKDERKVFQCPMDNCERLYYYKNNLQQHIDIYHLKKKQHRIKKTKIQRKKKDDPTRKDKGTIKRSTALKLSGLQVSYDVEKMILQGKQIEADNLEEFIDTSEFSEFSDLEINVKILRKEFTSSEDETRNNRSIRGPVIN